MFYGWVIVFSDFFIAFLVGGFVFYGFTAFFEAIVKEMGFTYAQVSFAGSLRGLEMGVFAPLAGYLVDRFGSRKLTTFGIVVAGTGILLLGFTRSLITFYSAFLFLALGTGCCSTIVLTTSVVNWFKNNQGLALGIVTSGFALSGIILPAVVWLIDRSGWRHTLFIVAFVIWAVGIPLSLLIKESPRVISLKKRGDSSSMRGFTEVIKERNLFLFSLSESLKFMVVSSIVIHIMPYLSSIGIERGRASFIASLIPLTSVVGRFGFGVFADVFDKKYTMAMTYALMVVSMWFLFMKMVFPFIFLFAIAYGGGITLRGALLSDYFDARTYGKALGVLMGFSSLGGVVGPSFAGKIFDIKGSYQTVWLVYAFASILSTVTIFFLENKSKDRS